MWTDAVLGPIYFETSYPFYFIFFNYNKINDWCYVETWSWPPGKFSFPQHPSPQLLSANDFFMWMCQSWQDTWLLINSSACTADPGETSPQGGCCWRNLFLISKAVGRQNTPLMRRIYLPESYLGCPSPYPPPFSLLALISVTEEHRNSIRDYRSSKDHLLMQTD